MKVPLFLLLASVTLAIAADGLLLELPHPPREGDRFQHADFSCWLPDPAQPVKALIIHQHGCTSASPDKHPPITGDWHWRALARKHHAALLVPMYKAKKCDDWNDPESGSERALFTAIDDFAKRSGRAELKDAPWVLWGHSGGSSWSAQMIVRHPGRVRAASFRGGCHRQFGVPEFREKFIAVARELPLLFVWGKRESTPPSSHFVSWVPMNTMFRELRSTGGQVTRVIDPRSEHSCDDSRLMSLSFFDAVLSGEAATGTFANIESLEAAGTNEAYRYDPAFAWMPNPAFAAQWREFSGTGTLRPPSAPSRVPGLWAERQADGAVRLSWRIVPEIAGGLRMVRLKRDGQPWKEFGVQPGDFLATARDSTPESLRPAEISDESTAAHTYSLTFLDAAGQESPSSAHARIGSR